MNPNDLRPLLNGLGLPDSTLALQAVLDRIKNGIITRRYEKDKPPDFSPYNGGLLVRILVQQGPAYGEVVQQITRHIEMGLKKHFLTATVPGERILDWAQMPTIGTSRCLHAFVQLGRTAEPAFKSALKWVLAGQNSDGGFGLNAGDHSRMFATEAVCDLLASMPQTHDAELARIGAFVRDTYNRDTTSWGVHADRSPEPLSPHRSGTALAIQTWRRLEAARIIVSDPALARFSPTISALTEALANEIPLCIKEEHAAIDLEKIRPIPLEHFTLVHALDALFLSGYKPWDPRYFGGLRLLKTLQSETTGGFRFGPSSDEQMWATVEAVRQLLPAESLFATELELAGRAFAARLVDHAKTVTPPQIERSRDVFETEARLFCKDELIPKLRITMHQFDVEDCLLVGEIRSFFGLRRPQVRVLVRPTLDVVDAEVRRWIALARDKKCRVVVITDKPLPPTQRQCLSTSNQQARQRVDLEVI